jgi:F-type H+-transporting ATPase subunit b
MFIAIATLAAEGGGFNPLDVGQGGNAFWTWIIFGLSVIPIWLIVMGPVTRGMLARDAKAAEAVLAAQRASQEAEKARADVEARLAEARAEAGRMVAEARGRAEVRERELTEAAKREAGALLARAREEILAEQDKAIAAIRAEVVDLSLRAASQVLKRKVDAADDRRLVEELVGAARSGRGGGA